MPDRSMGTTHGRESTPADRHSHVQTRDRKFMSSAAGDLRTPQPDDEPAAIPRADSAGPGSPVMHNHYYAAIIALLGLKVAVGKHLRRPLVQLSAPHCRRSV
jgi:hypothetical protein